MNRVKMTTAALLLLAFATPGLAQDGPFDRSEYFKEGTETSDDLRRVPIPPGMFDPPGSIVITGARLFDGTGAPARDAVIVIEGKKITKILAPGGTDWPANARMIDVGGRTVMPGLIDLHTHLTYVEDFGLPEPLSAKSQANAALRGVERLRYYVESGITSVRDAASHGMAPFMLKEWVAFGRIPGPRVFPPGQLIVGEGGHGTEGFGLQTAPGYPDSAVREAIGPDDWRAAVREQFKRGADWIKLASHYTAKEVAAAVDEAHLLGIQVMVDSETIFTTMAVEAGADTIEHPLPRTDEAIRMMAEKGIASVPTIVPYQIIIAESGGYWGSTSRRFTLTEETMFATTLAMKEAGVKLGVGTDLVAGWYKYLPDAYIQELRNFLRLGYTAPEALVAATKTSSEILGMDDRLGTLEVGMLADLIVIDGKPDENIEDLVNVETVIVNGRVVVEDGRVVQEPHNGQPTPGGPLAK
jgi:imidazolonepropionase-like amidohydrolase